MKKYFKLLALSISALLILAGCEKEENKIYFEGGTAPVLSASKAAVTLTPATQDENAITFNWTNPAYRFTTGVSSQDVTYTFEIDTVGSNFTGANHYVTAFARDISKSFTQKELNDILGNTMRLQAGRQYNLQARITSTIGSGSAGKLVSNIAAFTATPFAPPPKVPVPVTGKLYIVGDATGGGWNNPVPTPSQEFTKVSNTKYTIDVVLSASKFYLFLPENGSWSTKYAWPEGLARNPAGGPFEFRGGGGQDFQGPATAGTYRIVVDFQVGEFTVTKL
jgi:hypothetical protein